MKSTNSTNPRPALGILSRLAQAQAEKARAQVLAEDLRPPSGDTGGTSRQPYANSGKKTGPISEKNGKSASKYPPQGARASRAKQTSPEMQRWLGQWFFDWLAVTIPNSKNGKGSKRRASPEDIAKAGKLAEPERSEMLRILSEENRIGEAEAVEAQDRLCLWAVSQGLRQQRAGKGSDGYDGALHYGASPTDIERLVSIRAGHRTNMPGVEIPGGEGACARLAPAALELLGPVLLARADVSWDHSQEGLFDELREYARFMSVPLGMALPQDRTSETGRTFYWGKGEVSVKVYLKDMERVAKGRLDPADADPNLVRIEIKFAPKSDRKSGMALLAKQGAGTLIGTSHWVREFVVHLGEVTGMTKKGASIGVQRVPQGPDPRTIEERSGHGLAQYAATHCAAVVSQIVHQEFGGDWLAAEVSPDAVRRGVLEMMAGYLDATNLHEAAVTRLGVDRVRSIQEEAQRGSHALSRWMERQRDATEIAQERLLGAAHVAALKAAQGPEGSSSGGGGSSAGSSGGASGRTYGASVKAGESVSA